MKTVIFDLDGTLVDTATDIAASINHVRAERYGLPPLSQETIVRLMNRTGLNLAYEFYGVEAYDRRAREMFEAHYSRQCLIHAKSFEGIYELLFALKRSGAAMFVATNAPTKTSEIILKNNGIDAFFEDIVGADRVAYAKPHPQMIEKIVERRPKERCWMVGDSPKDILAARSAGITPIFARWGFAKEIKEEIEADVTADIPSDVLDIVCV
ncbi:HAD family hydrolase [Hydrogenimonas sp.]